MVEEGKPAPDFELPSDSGDRVSLSSLRGKPVVLYFYPKDDTPGCTTQACGIRDVYADFRERGAVVLGVSPDDEASHVKFKEKYSLPFTLLGDLGHLGSGAPNATGLRRLTLFDPAAEVCNRSSANAVGTGTVAGDTLTATLTVLCHGKVAFVGTFPLHFQWRRPCVGYGTKPV